MISFTRHGVQATLPAPSAQGLFQRTVRAFHTRRVLGLGQRIYSPRYATSTHNLAVLFTVALDTVETYFDSHVDLIQRKLQQHLQKHGDRLKLKAEETFKIKDLSGDLLAENFEREIKNFKLKVRHSILHSKVY